MALSKRTKALAEFGKLSKKIAMGKANAEDIERAEILNEEWDLNQPVQEWVRISDAITKSRTLLNQVSEARETLEKKIKELDL